MFRVLRLVFRSAHLILLAFIIQACGSNNLTSTTYSKDGLSFKLPALWKVKDDVRVSDNLRTLLVLSDYGDTLTLSIYPRGLYSAVLIPSFPEYFKRIVLDKIPTKRMRDSARVTHGVSERSSGEGLYAELIVSEPDPLHVFKETLRAEYKDFVVYFTFNSESPSLRYSNQVDLIIEGFEI